LPFARLADAAEAVQGCLGSSPSACELIDWRRLIMARDADPELKRWIVGTAKAALVVEFEGEDANDVERQASSLAGCIRRTGVLVTDPVISTRRADCERWMNLRRVVIPH